jgi:hypothetical protein
MSSLLISLALGWTAGFAAAWWYFLAQRLIRSRREWYADRRARGLPVPDDWEDGER